MKTCERASRSKLNWHAHTAGSTCPEGVRQARTPVVLISRQQKRESGSASESGKAIVKDQGSGGGKGKGEVEVRWKCAISLSLSFIHYAAL